MKQGEGAKEGVLRRAGKRAMGGGATGAVAMVLQVLLLMWLRTTMQFQHRTGASTGEAMRQLYAEGGVGRFYQGVLPALLQAPLCRFGDTAANVGVLELFQSLRAERGVAVPMVVQTLVASLIASVWRSVLMPIDTLKTFLQVEGEGGLQTLRAKVGLMGVGALYEGALGASLSTLVGHFPWFLTFNLLMRRMPRARSVALSLVRNAFCGFVASLASDCVSNCVRVVKTFKQTSQTPISYGEALGTVVAQGGVEALLVRGLATRLMTNAVSAMVFTVLWGVLQDRLVARPHRHPKHE